MEDWQIVDLYLRRNETAIKESADKYGKRLRSLAYGIVGDLRTADECENDTYMEAWNLIPPNEPREYLYAFLARITRHVALNCCRERKALKRNAVFCELSEEMEQCIPAPNDLECQIDDIALGDSINRFLDSLNEEKRKIFMRRYFFFDSISDIAKRYGLSESKVSSLLFRCRNKLRNHLIREGYEI